LQDGLSIGGRADVEGVEVAGALAGFVGATEGTQKANGGPGGALHIRVESAGLIVKLRCPFVVSRTFVEGAELEAGFDARDGEWPAVVPVEQVVLEAHAEHRVAGVSRAASFLLVVGGGAGVGESLMEAQRSTSVC
jgi:hypothetical protein